jgi:hypothetical protein
MVPVDRLSRHVYTRRRAQVQLRSMQMTLLGKGSKCRVCTHPDRAQIESMLARDAGIAAIEPLMKDTFSRRALYRHRAKHMIAVPLPAARPVPFPYSASPIKRVKWLQRELEHTAAMAEHRGDLSLKVKALHELERAIWLENRLKPNEQEPMDVSPGGVVNEYLEWRSKQFRGPRKAGVDHLPETIPESREDNERLERAFRRSSESYRKGSADDLGVNK